MARDMNKEMAKRTVKQHCFLWHELRYDEMHNKPYFIGKRDKHSDTEIIFPINCSQTFTFDELKSHIVDSESSAVNLAVYNTDSTTVLYKAELGLKPPTFLKDNSTLSLLDSSNDTLQSSKSLSKKRKIDSDLGSPRSNHSDTYEYLHIDSNSADSDINVVDHKNSDDSNAYSENN